MKQLFIIRKGALAVIALILSQAVVAQISLGLGAGASLPLSSIAIPGFVNIDESGQQELIAATVGAGINTALSFEYGVSETIALGLDLTYLKSFKGDLQQHNVPQPGAITSQSFAATALWVTPQLIGYFGKRFYSRFGMIIGVFHEVDLETEITGLAGTRTDVFESASALGLKTALGVVFPISEKLMGFAEIHANALTYRPGSIRNDRNFDGLPKGDPVQLNEKLPVNFDPSSEQPMMTIPYNNLGVNVGVKFQI